jgi:hypothetical protein
MEFSGRLPGNSLRRRRTTTAPEVIAKNPARIFHVLNLRNCTRGETEGIGARILEDCAVFGNILDMFSLVVVVRMFGFLLSNQLGIKVTGRMKIIAI